MWKEILYSDDQQFLNLDGIVYCFVEEPFLEGNNCVHCSLGNGTRSFCEHGCSMKCSKASRNDDKDGYWKLYTGYSPFYKKQTPLTNMTEDEQDIVNLLL